MRTHVPSTPAIRASVVQQKAVVSVTEVSQGQTVVLAQHVRLELTNFRAVCVPHVRRTLVLHVWNALHQRVLVTLVTPAETLSHSIPPQPVTNSSP